MGLLKDRFSQNTFRCLRFADVAPGRPYHAALSVTPAYHARGFKISEHTHDFYEMIFVLAGDAVHGVNGKETNLRAGNLVLLRPGDRHFIRFKTGVFLHYINIAVDASLWQNFHALIGVTTNTDAPVVRTLSPAASHGDTDDCEATFRRALLRFQDTYSTDAGLRTEACRFLASVAHYLFADGRDGMNGDDLPDGTPTWLTRACKTIQRDGDALRRGLPAFVAEAGVTRTHLARVLKAATNQTPTEYINRLRLRQAARLLATTTLSILDIAGECGFEQPTYFYRLFAAHFQTSPHAYRMASANRITDL